MALKNAANFEIKSQHNRNLKYVAADTAQSKDFRQNFLSFYSIDQKEMFFISI